MTDAQSQPDAKEPLPLAPKDMAPAPSESPPAEAHPAEAPLSPVDPVPAEPAIEADACAEGEAAATPEVNEEKPAPPPPPPPPPFRVEFQLPVAMYPNVTPKILLRGCQSEAILSWRESRLKRKIISLPTGCISGSAEIRVNRAGKGFKTTLEHLYYKFNGGASERGKTWDPSIPTQVRCLAGTDLRLHEIQAVLDQGMKPVVELALQSGKTLKLTPDHEVCVHVTETGDQTYRRVEDLQPGDVVLTNGTTRCKTCGEIKPVVTNPKAKHVGNCRECIHGTLTRRTNAGTGKTVVLKGYRYVSHGMRWHPNKFMAGGRYCVAEHRLVAEAHMNGVSFEEWLEICRTNSFTADHVFIPRGVDVHHKNHDKADNRIANLDPRDSIEHQIEHGRAGRFKNMNGGRGGKGGTVCFVPTQDRVVSVKPAGMDHVYDIVCTDPWRNFVANGVVVHNCGKTVTALAIASETTVGRVLWLAHRNELIEQPMAEVAQSFPDLEAGIVKAGANDNMARLVIGSVQTVSKRRRLKNIAEGSPFSLVVIDEAHHSTSKIYRGILDALGCFDEGGPDVLGLTATIERADKVSLNEVFEDVVYSISIAEAIDAGYLVSPRPMKVPLAIDPKALRVVDAEGEKDFNQADLEKELARVNAARATALAIKEHASDKKTIVFTVSVDQAKRTAAELQALGMKAAWASGAPHMTDAQRKDVISKLARREITVVANACLLTEGFDDKEVDCVVIARPTRSKAVYIQQVGRGLRLAPHKRDCLVIDIVGASDMGLVTIDNYLQETKKKTPRKRREPRDGPPDPEMEWKRIRSYLKSARVDLVPHGEATFARASDGLLVTVTADGEMLLVRRKDADDNVWVIERKGVEFTPPADIHATMDAACMLSREYGGTVAPGSEKWNAATEKQAP